MSLLSWLKGKKKQRQMRKLEPDKDFEFKEDYYGITNEDNIYNFKFVYCNNYTDKLYKLLFKDHLSFISCKITLPNTEKVLRDITKFMNYYINSDLSDTITFKYKNFYLEIDYNYINIYLRGDLSFYVEIRDNIHNNIITKFIVNNIFPDFIAIETPNEFLGNIYNSINCPSKPIDILFIEDSIECKHFKPVIGLSIKDDDKYNIPKECQVLSLNNRNIIYIEIDKLSNSELDYIVNNVNHGNKLLELVHKDIGNDDIDSDIDEIIEE